MTTAKRKKTVLDVPESKGLRERKKVALRERLYQTALKRFREASYDTVPVSDICKTAGVAKGTFFNHYPTKDHLLLEWYGRMTHVGNAILESEKPVFDRILELANAFFDICLADPDLWRAKRQRVSLNEDFRSAERESDEKSRVVICKMLQDAIDRGEIDARHDPQVHADLILALLTGTVHDWTINEPDFDIRTIVANRLAAYLSALAIHD